MAAPILNYRSPQPQLRQEALPYVDSRFVAWHGVSIVIGIGCLVLPRALGGFGFLLLALMPGIVFLHTLAIGFPLMFQGFKSSGPIVFRIAIGVLGLVGPALSACAFRFGWEWVDFCR